MLYAALCVRQRSGMRALMLAIFAWASFGAPASAEPPSAALRLYTTGDYLAAAAAAETSPSPSALVFASRALVAASMTASDRAGIDAWLARAETSASEALERDPDSVEARIQLALTLGIEARRTSVREAIRRDYAGRGRRLIRQAIARAPDNAEAHALMGGWHLEVIRRGGRAGAMLYGARFDAGIAAFERARTLAPNDGMIALHYAVALLQTNPDRDPDLAARLLAQTASHRPRDAFERYAVRQAARLAGVLEREGPEAASRAASEAFL